MLEGGREAETEKSDVTLAFGEICFTVIIVRKLLQRRVVQLSSSATNANSSEKLKEIKTIILYGYLNARGPNVSCAITCLLRKHP